MTTADMVNEHVSINTSLTLPFQHSVLERLNATAWEFWYFEGVSQNAKSGITIFFYRDNNLKCLGFTPFRISIDAVCSDGSKYSSLIFAEESTIETCDDVTRGRWEGPKVDSTFEITHGNEDIFINLNGTSYLDNDIYGSFRLKSFSNARYPKGETYPDRKASVQVAPLFYWNEGIPGGEVAVNLILNSTKLQFQGIGGADRNFAPYL